MSHHGCWPAALQVRPGGYCWCTRPHRQSGAAPAAEQADTKLHVAPQEVVCALSVACFPRSQCDLTCQAAGALDAGGSVRACRRALRDNIGQAECDQGHGHHECPACVEAPDEPGRHARLLALVADPGSGNEDVPEEVPVSRLPDDTPWRGIPGVGPIKLVCVAGVACAHGHGRSWRCHSVQTMLPSRAATGHVSLRRAAWFSRSQ